MIMRMVVGIVWLLLFIFLWSNEIVMIEMIFNFKNIWVVIVILYMSMRSCEVMRLSKLIIMFNLGIYELLGFCKDIII